MGMTKARVFPLPVTCGGTRVWWARARGSLRRETGGQSARGTHRLGSDILVFQEQRDGRGLEGETAERWSENAGGTDRRVPPSGCPAGSAPAFLHRPQRADPPPRPRGYLHRRHVRETQLAQRTQHPGVQRHRQRLPGPLRHVLHSEPRRRPPDASGTPAANTSASGRRPVRPGTVLGLLSSGERKGVLAAGDWGAD